MPERNPTCPIRRRRHRVVDAALACAAFSAALAAAVARAEAQGAEDLVARINEYRCATQTCDGARTTPSPPLVPHPALAAVQVTPDRRLLDALKAAGYPAASTQYMTVSGPAATADVLRFIVQRYCKPLTAAQFTDIGVARNGTHWQIILAQRLLSPELRDWQQAGVEVLRLTNAARATPRTCGGLDFGAAPPLAWNARLAAAALAHSRDMATHNYLDHVAPNGSRVDTRATKQGYRWVQIGENVAGGQGSAEQVVAGWIASPDHCVNVMDPKFTDMGAAYVVNPKGDKTIYWTQVFGATR
jgi:uncharacterized protein YkwD